MIAKIVPGRRDGRSSFGRLAAYIADEKGRGAKVETLRVSNCLSDDAGLAVREIEATQALNTRAKSSKTYHLIVSFRAGERPSDEALAHIEEEIARAVGLEGHQRISALHTDTANLHLHLAINKIDPVSFTMVTPFQDMPALSDACRRLEQQHGLEVDRHIEAGQERRRGGRAEDLEAHSGQESFAAWVAGEPAQALAAVLDKSPGWEAVHAALARYNLELRPRGAGFAVVDRDRPLGTRASHLGRRFSKLHLEQRLGVYRPPAEQAPATTRYEGRPIHLRRLESGVLFTRYQEEQRQARAARAAGYGELRAERAAALTRIREHTNQRRREVMEHWGIGRRRRRVIYQELAGRRRAEENRIRLEAAEKREELARAHQLMTWQAWLMREAERGDEAALAVLRSRPGGPRYRQEQGIAGDGAAGAAGAIARNLTHYITKDGAVVYRGGVRDEGRLLRVASAHDPAGLELALRLAAVKFSGRKLQLRGGEEFLEEAAATAARLGLRVEFEDPRAEHIRQGREAPAGGSGAVSDYLRRRNELSANVSDIIEHYPYDGAGGQYAYRGTRQLQDGCRVGLMEQGGRMAVLPLTDSQAKKLRRLRIGEPVQIDRRGRITRRGIERS